MQNLDIKDHELTQVILFFEAESGIRLSEQKRSLICGRLNSRLNALALSSYQDYLSYIRQPAHAEEKQMAVDLLTTNETYFFREPKHFEFMAQLFAQWHSPRPPAIWSAACSSGEEPYSVAMQMYEAFGSKSWQVEASDLSTRVLETARQGIFPLARARELSSEYRKKYCLKGQGRYDGYLMVQPFLQERVTFTQLNLSRRLPYAEMFDLVLLRNVLIYFHGEAKERVLRNVIATIKPGGYLLLGHSESINGLALPVSSLRPAIYQKVTADAMH